MQNKNKQHLRNNFICFSLEFLIFCKDCAECHSIDGNKVMLLLRLIMVIRVMAIGVIGEVEVRKMIGLYRLSFRKL